jgi:hypothetical protein
MKSSNPNDSIVQTISILFISDYRILTIFNSFLTGNIIEVMRLLMFSEIIPISFINHAESIKYSLDTKQSFFNVKAGGVYSGHFALQLLHFCIVAFMRKAPTPGHEKSNHIPGMRKATISRV